MTNELAAQESKVTGHAGALKKELGLWDLILTQIVFVVGGSWVGTAAKLGPSHLAYWLLALLLFYVPQAAVVQTEKGNLVFTVDADGKAQARPVKTGDWIGKDWTILSGLNSGDKVVVDNLLKLQPGAPVTEAPPPAAAATPAAAPTAPTAPTAPAAPAAPGKK